MFFINAKSINKKEGSFFIPNSILHNQYIFVCLNKILIILPTKKSINNLLLLPEWKNILKADKTGKSRH